jgi:hypothetical protein
MTRQTAQTKGKGSVRSLAAKRGVLVRLGKSLGTKTVISRREAESWLIERADADPTFRRALIANPGAVIAKELGLTFPPTIQLRVIEEGDRELLLVLPAPVALDERELDAVVGGQLAEQTAQQQAQAKEAKASNKSASSWGGVTNMIPGVQS